MSGRSRVIDEQGDTGLGNWGLMNMFGLGRLWSGKVERRRRTCGRGVAREV